MALAVVQDLPDDYDYRKNPVLAAHRWPDNSYLIEDCFKLGYLRYDLHTLDATYGRGVWWKRARPIDLICHDLVLDGTDFRHLPHHDGEFDQIAYDPPYMAAGGRETTKIVEMFERFGMTGAPRTPALLQDLINDGLTEMHRLVRAPKLNRNGRVYRRGGIVLVKCMSYVSSGSLWLGVHYTTQHALDLGFEVVDVLQHIGDPRPQPKRPKRKDGRHVVQQHSRNNYSTLLVLRRIR